MAWASSERGWVGAPRKLRRVTSALPRRLGTAWLIPAALILSACAHTAAEDASGWRLSRAEPGPQLRYVEGNEVQLNLACPSGSTVEVFYDAPVYAGPAEPRTILRSGDISAELDAEPTSIRPGGTAAVRMSAEIPAGHPVLAAFSQTGRLAVSKFGPFVQMNAEPAALPRVRTFLDQCQAAASAPAPPGD